MKLQINQLKYLSFFCLLFSASRVFAQDEKETENKGTLTEEIEVVRPYRPILADAVKIRRNPDLDNKQPFKPTLTYSVLDKKLDLNTDIKQLQAQKLTEQKELLQVNNYAKIGFGNFNTGTGELYFNTGKDEALQAGFFLKHLSQQGDLNKQQASSQQASVFGRSIGDAITFSGNLSYNRRASYFYGFNPQLAEPGGSPDKQRLNLIEAEGEMINSNPEAAAGFNYVVKANAYLFGNLGEGRENSVLLSGQASKAFNQFSFGVGTSADFTSTKDSLYNIANHIFRLNPFVKYEGNGFVLNIGLNLVQEFGDSSRFNILPAASAEIPIAAEYATLFAGISGDVLKTSLRGLTDENLYLNNNVGIRNKVEKLNIYGGIKGNAGSGLGFKATAYIKTVENLPLFINNPYRVSRFDVVYDGGESTILGLEGEINIKASDVLNLSGKAQINKYDLATEDQAWFKPGLRLSSSANAKINKQFNLNAELVFNGETRARTYVFTPLLEEQSSRIKSFMDLSAQAEYQFKNRIGVYLRANNIFGNNYQQYLYYPTVGLNILGGFNYAF